MRKKICVLLLVFFATTAHAQLTGEFSRANCVTNNESITLIPFDPFQRAVVSWHRPSSGSSLLHFAGHEDPLACASPPCPTSPGPLEDAICFPSDGCLWGVVNHTVTGRWAGIHNLFGLDADNSIHAGPWTVEGRHTIFFGVFFTIPIFTVTNSGPVTDCSL